VDVKLTVDRGDASWTGTVGVVTVLLQDIPCDVKSSVAVVCGPPLMMKFATLRLLEAGFPGENIYLSMEKNMSCGLGQCGHCRMGIYFTCRDGPVLTWDQVKDIEEPFA
jgi:NAD(P)H-flavin reductase